MKVRMRDGTGTRDYKYLLEDVDRFDRVRIYFQRRKGEPKIRLREQPGTPAFHEEYLRAFREQSKAAAPQPKTGNVATPGTLRWLVELYYRSARFEGLDQSTRKVRRGQLDAICARHGTLTFKTMEPRHVAALRDEKAAFPEAANARVKALRVLFSWACDPEYRYAERNPARDVGYLDPNNPDGFHTWTAEEIRQYQTRHGLGSKARLALDLLLYTGTRKSDAVRLGPQMESNGSLRYAEHKGRKRHLKEHEIPILPELRASIDATPSGHLNYLTTKFGKPFTVNGFGNWFKRRCREAGLEHCSAHGLRKAGATIAAENGASDRQLMAIYGWTTTKQANIYTKKASNKKLATDAMPLISLKQIGNEILPLSPLVKSSGRKTGRTSN